MKIGIEGEVHLCVERELCVCNKYFNYKNVHTYTRMVRGRGGMEVMSMIDLVLVKRDTLKHVHNVKTVEGMGQGILDHSVVLCNVMLVGTGIKGRKEEEGKTWEKREERKRIEAQRVDPSNPSRASMRT